MTAISASSSGVQAAEREACACAHCSLPVPGSMFVDGADEQFCCHGCEAARGAILACGLENYYALRDQAKPAAERSGAAAVFDDPDFLARHATALKGGAMRTSLCLEGVHCAACLWLLERLPSVVGGLLSLELDLGRSTAVITWDPAVVKLSSIARDLARFGYPAHPVEPSARRNARARTERRALAEIGVAAACMGNVMLLAFALYSGEIDQPYDTLFRVLSAAIGVLAVAWPGRVFFRSAVAAVRARTWHLDTPIAVALGVGTLAGVINVARGAGEIYFDSITMLVMLLLIGRWLQARQQHRATEAVELLFSMTPRTVRLVDEDDPAGSVSEVMVESVSAGQLVEVLAEHCVPVDGVIESGESVFDESVLTGESVPIARRAGDAVAAGTGNLRRAVRVRVSASGRETRIGKLMGTIETLSRSRVPLIGSADRLAKPFVITTLSVATVCLLVHLASGWGTAIGVEMAIQHTVALLIVVCPCAIAMATPLATSVAIGRLASRGILVKGGDVMEALAGTPVAMLDKTGTLTDGRFVVRSWLGDSSVRDAVAATEAGSSHPIAVALSVGADASVAVDAVTSHAGLGIEGLWNGERMLVGSDRFLESMGVAIDPALNDLETALAKVFVACGGVHCATALLGDDVRADSAQAVAALHERGWETEIASGDDEARVARVGEMLGVGGWRGRVTPEQKLERVHELSAGRSVVMIGDGVNDSAALAAADVGIAVHGGAEASLAAADVYLNRPGMGPVLELVDAARTTTRRVRACLITGLSYNAVAATLAILGLLSPVMAAVLMPASSLTVLAIALAGVSRKRHEQEGGR